MESRVRERRYLKSDRSVLYINIIVHDASGAIGNKIRAKVDGSRVPNRLKNVVTSAATSVAGNVVTPAVIAKKMGQKLCQKMPEKMLKKGITAFVEEAFREGPYVVFQLQVQHVNLATLTESKLGGTPSVEDSDDDKSKKKKDDDHTSAKKSEIVDATPEPAQPQDVKHWFMHLLELFFQLIGVSNQRTIEEDVLPGLIHRKLESAMGEILAEKMGEKFLDAESKVCSAANQARYFFDKLKEVRKGEENND
jgi:hypothetical protein